MNTITRFCNICERMIPVLFNGVSYPCPKFRGQGSCIQGFKWMKETPPLSKNQHLNNK